MIELIWSKPAQIDYWENIEFLLDEWTESEASAFIFKTDALLQIIKESPKTFRRFNYKQNIHTVPVTKEINLFYQVRKDKVELLRFWNNHQDPKKLILKKS
ncbi:MAG: type II toxin-antitoxin system RelE/ParE family toxin [Crocinitomix sp.]|nr:type II toxin-antitoxin system RelE/ParE family toxin [Crocinitomix sp.]